MLTTRQLKIFVSLILAFSALVRGYRSQGYQYLYPLPYARHVAQEAHLMIRFENISPFDIMNMQQMVTLIGESGQHCGDV